MDGGAYPANAINDAACQSESLHSNPMFPLVKAETTDRYSSMLNKLKEVYSSSHSDRGKVFETKKWDGNNGQWCFLSSIWIVSIRALRKAPRGKSMLTRDKMDVTGRISD